MYNRIYKDKLASDDYRFDFHISQRQNQKLRSLRSSWIVYPNFSQHTLKLKVFFFVAQGLWSRQWVLWVFLWIIYILLPTKTKKYLKIFDTNIWYLIYILCHTYIWDLQHVRCNAVFLHIVVFEMNSLILNAYKICG